MANILGKVLSGVASGFLQNRSDLRANRQQDENWQKQQERRRQELDMNEEYNIKREDRQQQNQIADETRQRQNRIGDEEAAYQKAVSRTDEMTNKKIREIAKLDPERWKDQKFQRQVTMLVKGIKVPPLPADKRIADFLMNGQVKEAMQLAMKSDNPEDQQFFQTAVSSIKQAETLKKLLNPEPTNDQRYGIKLDNDFIQGALDQGNSAASGIISKFIPGMEQTFMSAPTKSATNEKTIKPKLKSLKDEYAFIAEGIDRAQRDAKDLLDSDPERKRLLLEVVNDKKKLDVLRQRINSAYAGEINSTATGSNRSLKDLLSEAADF